jgi:hypothetical protein
MASSPNKYRFESHIEKSLQSHGYTRPFHYEYIIGCKELLVKQEKVFGLSFIN